ncbi:MAG: TPR end-of-group domain-containing protein, partial [Longimicrobiales bacterium]
ALASAAEHYQKALEEDSSFTPAEVGLAQVRLRLESRADVNGEVPNPERHIIGARRLASASHFLEAEGILRELALEADEEASQEAWKALEQIQAIQGDFEGVIGLRMERLTLGLADSRDSIALLALEGLVEEKGEEGFWVWKLGDLETLAANGVEVSPVEVARARVGIGDLEGALPYLESAVEKGDKNLVRLWTDPAWDALRADPRFKEIFLRVRRSAPRGGYPLPD